MLLSKKQLYSHPISKSTRASQINDAQQNLEAKPALKKKQLREKIYIWALEGIQLTNVLGIETASCVLVTERLHIPRSFHFRFHIFFFFCI